MLTVGACPWRNGLPKRKTKSLKARNTAGDHVATMSPPQIRNVCRPLTSPRSSSRCPKAHLAVLIAGEAHQRCIGLRTGHESGRPIPPTWGLFSISEFDHLGPQAKLADFNHPSWQPEPCGHPLPCGLTCVGGAEGQSRTSGRPITSAEGHSKDAETSIRLPHRGRP